jgi:hypothetical protein
VLVPCYYLQPFMRLVLWILWLGQTYLGDTLYKIMFFDACAFVRWPDFVNFQLPGFKRFRSVGPMGAGTSFRRQKKL